VIDGFGTLIPTAGAQFNLTGRLPLLLITLLLGGLGGHKIYLQKYPLAALYGAFFWTGIPSLVSLVEFVLCAAKGDTEFEQNYPAPTKKEFIASIVLPVLGLILYAVIFAFVLGGGDSVADYNEIAASDASACRNILEGYYAQKRMFPQSADDLAAAGCRGSENVALFVLPKDKHYVIVSYHLQGDKAYLHSRRSEDVQELAKEAAVAELNSAFNIVEEADGVALIAQ